MDLNYNHEWINANLCHIYILYVSYIYIYLKDNFSLLFLAHLHFDCKPSQYNVKSRNLSLVALCGHRVSDSREFQISGLWTRDDPPVFAKLTNYANKFCSNSWIFSFRSFLCLGILGSVF